MMGRTTAVIMLDAGILPHHKKNPALSGAGGRANRVQLPPIVYSVLVPDCPEQNLHYVRYGRFITLIINPVERFKMTFSGW
jgi:hypothetical protein